MEFNQPIQVHEKIKPQKDDSVRIEVTLTQEQFAELEQAKSLLSHICPDGNWSGIITTLAEMYNNRKLKGRSSSSTHLTPRVIVWKSNSSIKADYKFKPKPKPKPRSTFSSSSSSKYKSAAVPVPTPTSPSLPLPISTFRKRPRKYISLKTKRYLLGKAQYCCEYFDSNSKKNVL